MTSDQWTRVHLGQVATQFVDRFDVQPGESYSNLGVKWYAEGVFAREPKLGFEIKAKILYRVRPGQFIYNRMFATEGSFALVRDVHANGVVSNEFPVFDLDRTRLLPEFLALHFQQPAVWERVAQECVGTTKSRSRWKEDRFLAYTISLPPIPEQRRAVDLIHALDDALEAAEEALRASTGLLRTRREFAMHEGAETRVADDVFQITMGRQRSPQHASGKNMIPYLRSANVLDGQLDMADVNSMNFTLQEQQKYSLVVGDVLVTEGSASQDAVGAAALWNGELSGAVGFQNTLLRFRAKSGVTLPAFVFHWCRWAYESGAFREAANGTTILHIGSKRAEKMLVNVPDLSRQEAIVDELDAFEAVVSLRGAEVESLRRLRTELIASLLSGTHRIPVTYDGVMGA